MRYMFFFFTAFLPLLPFYVIMELYIAFSVVGLVKRATFSTLIMIGWCWSVDGEIYCMVVRDCLFAAIQFLLYFCYIYLLAVYINYYCINIFFSYFY